MIAHDTEDKLWWCKEGSKKEYEFVQKNWYLGFRIGKKNKYDIDFTAPNGLPADLKYRTEPFFTSWRYGFDPQYTVTINTLDIERYLRLHSDVLIVFWVDYPACARYGVSINELNGIWITSARCIQKRVDSKQLAVHRYSKRDGTDGNKTDSYLYDLRWCKTIGG